MYNKITEGQLKYLKSLYEKAFGEVTKPIEEFTKDEASKDIKRLLEILEPNKKRYNMY